ncbi:hypothetical protein [Pseudomonas izuensis]|uniref:Uncharacterized protein n=1 Tax=Pseudomonas izuensis TaxID=2684212 RepID=A0ABM7RVZ2_9PSED|nr:hypothetical protein [Pseudomonas izuensis]BCX69209.1 hypothetical protein LAB08_R38510 [Pseudomonas izuensis]
MNISPILIVFGKRPDSMQEMAGKNGLHLNAYEKSPADQAGLWNMEQILRRTVFKRAVSRSA